MSDLYISRLTNLFQQYFHLCPSNIEPLPQAGSDRRYYRLSHDNIRVIGAINQDVLENDTFINLSRHFKSKGIAVPQVYIQSEDRIAYLQEDLGQVSLYSLVKDKPFTAEVENLYKKTLAALVRLQIDGADNFNFTNCYPVQVFDRTSMFWDLNSFKYYFARPLRIMFHEPSLQKDFHKLTDWLLKEPLQFFMMRDCQARNVMIQNGEPVFIDFQGGRKGAMQYDVASLLWQAGAQIPMNKRFELFDYYMYLVQSRIPNLSRLAFTNRFHGYLLIRMLQVLGAYGFRGLIEGRSHFIESIPLALKNIDWFMKNVELPIKLPEIYSILEKLIQHPQFQPQPWQTAEKKLLVRINSFSYKRGLPTDPTGNGGGFIFDCRGILNPGRYESYRSQTGKDSGVIQFLKTKSQVDTFLAGVFKTIDINIQTYLARGFENLQINFGCTGGQHRSVYCAEATKNYIERKYQVQVVLHHIEQEITNKLS